jgi:DNA invertase Pin-like site-specific DNA recombinase
MKGAAVYARVSTHNGQNPEMQLDEIREYCRRRGWKIVGEYVDEGISGSKEHRPALDRLLADCRRRIVDAVVVYRYDRFARSLRQLVNALDEFRALGIDFVSLHEGVDTSTPNGRLVFGIFGSVAEFERELIRDRVRSGLALARSRGKRLGGKAACRRRCSQGGFPARPGALLGLDLGRAGHRGRGTAQRACAGLPKNPSKNIPATA